VARRYLKIAAFGAAYLALWVTYDLSRSTRHDLRRFDPHEVARIETAMWHSYYDHRPVKLFVELSTLLRRQFELPFWRSCQGAYYAARSAVVFQKGRQRAEYLRALPDLVDYYGLIRGSSVTAFDTQRVAELELEWWIAHRQAPGSLPSALAELPAAMYSQPAADFAEHARLRTQAMLLRDGGGDWGRIGELLDRSWTSLHDAVNPAERPPLRSATAP
jgi:hypothetical protein